MPRTARAIRAGIWYHVINRANARATVFHDAHDYSVFVALAHEAARRTGTAVLAYCLMPNHFHFVLRPSIDEGLSKWAHWLLTSHVSRYQRRHEYRGRVWQGRYKALPVQDDAYLHAVMRYVEANALRAGMVERAEDWPWGSLAMRARTTADTLAADVSAHLPQPWISMVNMAPQSPELDDIRRAVRRGSPYGDDVWVRARAADLGLEHTVRLRGRPRRSKE